MSGDLTPEAFDALMDTGYPAAQDTEDQDAPEYLEAEFKAHPDLVGLREHIRTKLNQSDYFSWRGGDEIESFVEGFTAAAILLRQNTDQ